MGDVEEVSEEFEEIQGFHERYDFNITDFSANYLIDNFDELGITDPFPNEKKDNQRVNFSKPERVDDFVYPKSRMMDEYCSPRVIYLPSKDVMLKLMRACIGVRFEDELWFN